MSVDKLGLYYPAIWRVFALAPERFLSHIIGETKGLIPVQD